MDISFHIEDVWQEYNMDRLEEGLETLFPGFSVSLKELLEQILTGDVLGAVTGLFRTVTDDLGAQLTGFKNILVWLLVLGIVSALMSYFSDIFENVVYCEACESQYY